MVTLMALPTVASVVTSGLGAYPTLYFDRVALDTIQSNLFMYPACEYKTLPDRSGNVIRIFDNTSMTANTTAATEGTPAAGQALTENTRDITLSQFVDYVSFSDKAIAMHLVDVIAEGAALLAYRGALSVDTVISTAVDVASNTDSATRIDVNHLSFLTAAIARQAYWGLRKSNIKPKPSGKFFGVLPSVQAFDLVNDNTAGGALDLQKYAESTAVMNPALVGIQGARVGVVGGVEWYESNALPTETNWQSSASNAYHAYVFGLNAFIAASLGKTALGQKNFSIDVKRFNNGNSIDIAGLIAAGASYNFQFGVSKRTGSTNGFRRIRSESTIG